MNSGTNLIRCYENAALQRHIMRPRIEDIALEEDGWTFSYAIDTNVVACYLNPSENALRNENMLVGVGDIFDEDQRENKENIARLISEYILFTLTGESKLIALAPINIEIKNLYLSLAGSFLTNIATPVTIDDKLLKRIEQASNSRSEGAKDVLLDALRLSLSGTPALNRIRDITRRARIIGSDMVTAETHGGALASSIPRNRIENLHLAYHRSRWMRLLRQVGRAGSHAAERDAEALARLEICNKRLQEANEHHKLLYVTTDTSLLEAAEVESWEGVHGASTFAREFIRHPRAYLDEPEVLRPSRERNLLDAETLYGWLTVLFEGIEGLSGEALPTRGEINFSDETQRSLREVAEKGPDVGDKIIKKWTTYARDAFADAPKDFVCRLIESLDNTDAAARVEALWNEIKGEAAQAWEQVFSVSVSARFALEVATPQSEPDKLPPRETPHLVFEGRTALHRFLESAQRWLKDPTSFHQKEYDDHRKAVQKEYDGDYGDYMAHAYLFSQEMQWKSAEILASLATSKVYSEQTNSATESNGRESSYLEAYSGRLTSTCKDELEKPINSILRAVDLFKKEKDVTEKAGGEHDCAVERFEVELLILQMTEHLYDWADGLGGLSELDAIRHQLGEMSDKIQSRIFEVEGALVAPPYDKDMILAGLRSALSRCYRSGLGLALQLGKRDPLGDMAWRSLAKMVADGGCPSQFAKFVLDLGEVLFDSTVSMKRKRSQIGQLEAKLPISIMSYDRKRYRAMLLAVRSLIETKETVPIS